LKADAKMRWVASIAFVSEKISEKLMFGPFAIKHWLGMKSQTQYVVVYLFLDR
jgi:hypothetical protein